MFSTRYFEPWKTYHTPIVRQLAFAIASPNIISTFPEEISSSNHIKLHPTEDWGLFYQAYQKRLQYLDQYPSELLQFLAKIKSTRLGLRFEALLWFWLQDPENQYFELLGHSIQSHSKGITLGEIDFLLRNRLTNEIEHWEVCLKYYLAEPDLKLANWIGLNPDDTFGHKLNHLIHKQFQFKSALGHDIEQRKVIIKGQLYLPSYHTPIPLWINQKRRLGHWQSIPPYHQSYLRLTRQEWLCPNLHQAINTSPIWWTNGLYYQPENDCFTMLKLKQQSYIYHA